MGIGEHKLTAEPPHAGRWWHGAVIYQVYPRSFLDSNDDGIGDLKGVLHGLNHIAKLGVDAIWLSPFFTSPMDDFGYDVADYCNVDPIFGDLSDFDALITKAHNLGIKVIIDQVYSHTSDQHLWFQESRTNKTNEKSDWYVWADPKPDGSPPNNWQSVFSGTAWEWDSRRQQYYLHNFLHSQPDLNLHNRDVQDALLGVTKFWLDRGVDGFRLDAINFAMHDPALRDNPPALVDGHTPTRPFDYQDHLYNQSHPDIPEFLERIRAITDQYDDIFTVAEVVGAEPLDEMKAFTAGNKHLNSAYNFSFLYAEKLSAALVRNTIMPWGENTDMGWPSWAFSNHDAPRAVSRWTKREDRAHAANLYLMLLFSLRGNIFLYQGEELGLPQAEVPFACLQDPEAIANWPLTLGRDGARTPIPWSAAKQNAGFSAGTPWLPVDQEHFALSVSEQEDDPDSVLQFTRKLIAMRKKSSALQKGDLEIIPGTGDILAFWRTDNNERFLCVFNLGNTDIQWLPSNASHFKTELTVNLIQNDDALPGMLSSLSGYIARKEI